MTQSEFIKKYLAETGLNEESWNKAGQFAIICECGKEDCEGWAMINKDGIQAQIDLYLKK